MLYCGDCATRNGWPQTFFRSRGPCEACGVTALCSDLPSSQLPVPRRPGWQPGDRVTVALPDEDGLKGRRGSWAWFSGTVREVDPPGLAPGVTVDLDQQVNGLRDCFATHAELRREES